VPKKPTHIPACTFSAIQDLTYFAY